MLTDDLDELDRQLALPSRFRVVTALAIGAVVVFGIVVRFKTNSALWLDEALTVDISRLPLHAIPGALKRDGAPPSFYVLLHFWMRLFGDSDLAVRSLSGVLAVLTLPVSWLAARRIGGRVAAWTVLVLLASAPFAVYYATEARMYALVILLTACGMLALQRALTAPKPGNLIALGVVTAGLLYTQYWSLYLVAITALWLAGTALVTWRRGGGTLLQAPSISRVGSGGHRDPGLLAVGADLPLPVGAHGNPVGQAAQLLGRHQCGHGVH